MADYFNYERAALQTDIDARLANGDDASEILPIVVARHVGNAGMVADLLKRGGSAEATGKHSMRLVHLAITSGKPEVLALLVERGADLTHTDYLGNSYVDWAGAAPIDPVAMSGSVDFLTVESGWDRERRRAQVLAVLTEALTKQGLPTEPTNRFTAKMHWPN